MLDNDERLRVSQHVRAMRTGGMPVNANVIMGTVKGYYLVVIVVVSKVLSLTK